jgi:hypothetical protein
LFTYIQRHQSNIMDIFDTDPQYALSIVPTLVVYVTDEMRLVYEPDEVAEKEQLLIEQAPLDKDIPSSVFMNMLYGMGADVFKMPISEEIKQSSQPGKDIYIETLQEIIGFMNDLIPSKRLVRDTSALTTAAPAIQESSLSHNTSVGSTESTGSSGYVPAPVSTRVNQLEERSSGAGTVSRTSSLPGTVSRTASLPGQPGTVSRTISFAGSDDGSDAGSNAGSDAGSDAGLYTESEDGEILCDIGEKNDWPEASPKSTVTHIPPGWKEKRVGGSLLYYPPQGPRGGRSPLTETEFIKAMREIYGKSQWSHIWMT